MGTTNADVSAYCLDLTRLISRVGRGPLTGIDRVERAYLRELIGRSAALYLLVRVGRRQYLLDRRGAEALWQMLEGLRAWPRSGLSRLVKRNGRLAAETAVRRLSVASARPGDLAPLLRAHLPPGVAFYNVGHANLDTRVLAAMRSVAGATVNVMIHDTIPLDFPAFQRPGIPEAFSRRLAAAVRHAHRIICVSNAAAADLARHMGPTGPTPRIKVAHLGVTVPEKPGTVARPGLPPASPYFLALGTIEPRKNHALLLDVWQAMPDRPERPILVIAGQRGWANDEVFARLDRGVDGVIEINDLEDAEVWALLAGARALLFPTHAEGFGLPAAEAAWVGTPVICNDLPVFREILRNYPVYADISDRYSWETKIKELAECRPSANDGRARAAVESLTWTNHFATVLDDT